MQSKINLPWVKINDYLLEIGKERNPRDLCVKAFKKLNLLIPFDIGMLYVLNENLKPNERVFVEMKPSLSKEYLEYYSKLEHGRFSYLAVNPDVIDWDKIEDCEFKIDYIKPQRINCTTSVKFFSADYWLTSAFVINRTGKCIFTQTEMEILKVIRSHLANLHANLFIAASKFMKQNPYPGLKRPLTRRESEIADMLLRGMSPKQISIRNFLNLRTVHNHLANIYEKVDVSSQWELIAKLMNRY